MNRPVVAFVACLTVLTCGLLAPAATAQPYPPAPPRMTVVISTPGATITVQGGRNWGPGTRVTIVRRDGRSHSGTVGSQSTSATSATALASTVVRPDGGFAVDVTVPKDARPGTSFSLLATGTDATGAPRTEETEVKVTDPAAADAGGQVAAARGQPAADETAHTGAWITNGLLVALGALVAGVILVVVLRRRASG